MPRGSFLTNSCIRGQIAERSSPDLQSLSWFRELGVMGMCFPSAELPQVAAWPADAQGRMEFRCEIWGRAAPGLRKSHFTRIESGI